MSETIVCRSPAEIRDDELCDLHTKVAKAQVQMCGGRLLYLGRRQVLLSDLRKDIEGAILGENDLSVTHLWNRYVNAIRF